MYRVSFYTKGWDIFGENKYGNTIDKFEVNAENEASALIQWRERFKDVYSSSDFISPSSKVITYELISVENV